MSVSVLIISHQDIATAFLKAAYHTFGQQLPLTVSTAEIDLNADPDKLIPELQGLAQHLDEGDGILVLTDLFGSTPSNIAQAVREVAKIRIVSGLNLPMLLRVLNYAKLPLNELADKAREGGQSGIVECQEKGNE